MWCSTCCWNFPKSSGPLACCNCHFNITAACVTHNYLWFLSLFLFPGRLLPEAQCCSDDCEGAVWVYYWSFYHKWEHWWLSVKGKTSWSYCLCRKTWTIKSDLVQAPSSHLLYILLLKEAGICHYVMLCCASKVHTGLLHLYHYRMTTLLFYFFLKSLIMKTQMSVSGATKIRIL